MSVSSLLSRELGAEMSKMSCRDTTSLSCGYVLARESCFRQQCRYKINSVSATIDDSTLSCDNGALSCMPTIDDDESCDNIKSNWHFTGDECPSGDVNDCPTVGELGDDASFTMSYDITSTCGVDFKEVACEETLVHDVDCWASGCIDDIGTYTIAAGETLHVCHDFTGTLTNQGGCTTVVTDHSHSSAEKTYYQDYGCTTAISHADCLWLTPANGGVVLEITLLTGA